MTQYTELVAEDMPTVEDQDCAWLTKYLQEQRELSDRMNSLSASLEEANAEITDLRVRLQTTEFEINHHSFALFNPDGQVQKLVETQIEKCHSRSRRGAAHQFFKALTLGCAALIFGCVVAANISVDTKQRGELSTAVACTSAVAAWAIVMMGLTKGRDS